MSDIQESTQTTLRDTLEANFEAAESGTLPTVSEVKERARDDVGRFAKTEKPAEKPADPVVQQEPELARPTTWKKEYLPLWDKLQTGQQLTPDEARKFLQYANQRENEYKSGVSAYKSEAENAKQLQEAIAPFVPTLQQHGIHPATWIQNLGRAHQMLANGSLPEKIQLFAKLAQDYGVPIGALTGQPQQGGLDPRIIGYLQNLATQVQDVAGWRQQQEQNALQAEISKYETNAEQYPHFNAVRGTMAQLLETGLASDLNTAYQKAVRMQDDVWQQEQEKLLAQAKTETSNARAIAKARQTAVSPKSATPSAVVTAGTAKDRRSLLADQLDSVGGRL